MSEPNKTIHTKLDELRALLETLSNFAMRIDQNTVVLAGRLDAIEPEMSQVRTSVHRLETALVHVARDVHEIRERVLEQDDRLGGRLRVLETNGRGNGHG